LVLVAISNVALVATSILLVCYWRQNKTILMALLYLLIRQQCILYWFTIGGKQFNCFSWQLLYYGLFDYKKNICWFAIGGKQ
jgi:hypothetical protein